ncbi:hypothetical protein ACFQPA_13355 [Halomarina halobia]|uniref:Uncharacterized protein n=1 Tax=Halomarina halobia TaxID=3033386 RepID=A0ABD6AAB9_9EURY|nr:hypothetical protein [Halomarina sp. PSR21]
MGGKKAEACGRCAMTSVVSVTLEDDEERSRDPYGDARIEVADREARLVSPGAWLGGLKSRLDEAATRLTYGR